MWLKTKSEIKLQSLINYQNVIGKYFIKKLENI